MWSCRGSVVSILRNGWLHSDQRPGCCICRGTTTTRPVLCGCADNTMHFLKNPSREKICCAKYASFWIHRYVFLRAPRVCRLRSAIYVASGVSHADDRLSVLKGTGFTGC